MNEQQEHIEIRRRQYGQLKKAMDAARERYRKDKQEGMALHGQDWWRMSSHNRMLFFWSDKKERAMDRRIIHDTVFGKDYNLWYSGLHAEEFIWDGKYYEDRRMVCVYRNYLRQSFADGTQRTYLHLDCESMASIAGDIPLDEFISMVRKHSSFVDYYGYDYPSTGQPLRPLSIESVEKEKEVLHMLETASFEPLPNIPLI